MKIIKNILPLLLLITIAFSFSSCQKDDPEAQAEKDRRKILEYIQENDLDAIEHESGLFYVMDVEGSGSHPSETATVIITYTGKLLNDDVFDSGNSSRIPLAGTIEGWRKGIPLFKRGGEGMLIIPSGMAYGSTVRPSIPANSVLVFNIELIDFNN